MNRPTPLLICLFCILSSSIYAQTIDTLSTQVIQVNTSYNPTVEEAYRIVSNPNQTSPFEQEVTKLNFAVKPVEVASTFNPQQGKMDKLSIFDGPRKYNNYLYAGFGSNGLPDLTGVLQPTIQDHELSILGHYYGTIDGVADAKTSVFSHRGAFLASHERETRKFIWDNSMQYHFQAQNWYGLPENFEPSPTEIENLNSLVQQHQLKLKGSAYLIDKPIEEIYLKADLGFDNYETFESLISLGTNFKFSSNRLNFDIPVSFNYGNTSFSQSDDYQYFDFKVAPVVEFSPNTNLYLKAGFQIDQFNHLSNNSSRFYMYPDIAFSYAFMDSWGLQFNLNGEVDTNSYQQAFQENPFVAPALELKPSFTSVNVFAKANKEFNKTTLGFGAGFKQTEDEQIFSKLPSSAVKSYAYQYGNAFQILYDRVSTTYVKIEAETTITNGLTASFQMLYQIFNLENLEYFYNQAPFKTFLQVNYERSKFRSSFTLYSAGPSSDFVDGETYTIDEYVDINLHSKYNISEKSSIHLKLNNILNQNYQEFSNYGVQGFQILGGFSYLFNF